MKDFFTENAELLTRILFLGLIVLLSRASGGDGISAPLLYLVLLELKDAKS